MRAERDAIIVQTHIHAAARERSVAPGPVPTDLIESVRARYVPVRTYDALADALRSRRLLVLIGPHASGRSTTALHLLDVLTNGQVSRLDLRTGAQHISEHDIEAGRGYLGRLGPSADGELGEVAADKLAELLEEKGAFCVLTAMPSSGLRRDLGRYTLDCPPVDPIAVLEQHIEAGITHEDDQALGGHTTALANSRRIRAAVGSAARPTDVADVADVLLRHGRGEFEIDEAVERIEAIVLDSRIQEWFSVLTGSPHGQRAERARRMTATRIAVAVFDDLPRHLAEEAAKSLAGWMARPPDNVGSGLRGGASGTAPVIVPRSGSPILDPEEVNTLLATTPIDFERREVPFGKATVPGEVVRYRDPRMPAAVLQCVWHAQYLLRDPVIAWLDELSRDRRRGVRLRAAQAAGLLCSLDFSHTIDQLVIPAARARPERRPGPDLDDDDDDLDDTCEFRREFAAVAMDHVARDPQLREAVRGLLKRWRRNDDPALRWTASYALGFDVGARDAPSALDELRVLGTPSEAKRYRNMDAEARRREVEVFRAAASGVANLFGRGAHRSVLAALHRWVRPPSRWTLRLLALQTIVYLIQIPVAAVGRADVDGGARIGDGLLDNASRELRGRWPVLLALHGTRSQLMGQAAEVVRAALRSSERRVVAEVFGEWLDFAASNDGALVAVEAFFTKLVVEESDRLRLLGLVRTMRRSWEDPLPGDVADRLENVIAGIPVVQGRTVDA